MNYYKLIVTVLGGLALFLYGMGLMSDGLTQVAGARMRKILGYITKNRIAAIAAGAGVTALIQSSSATTVMTVGFVNAGLLSLTQAIGVVFGANIGTTITGQLVSLKLTDLALPAVIVSVVGLMIARKTLARGAWRTLLGFGLLFFGMNMMSHELKTVAKLPEFVAFFSSFDCSPSASGFLPFGNVLGAVFVGTLCTMVVQSSSATIGITIALANAGLINIWTAVPIVLGDNIGTTITAVLASIGTNANARRTALAHALFNVIGTLIMLGGFFIVVDNSPVFFHLLKEDSPGRNVAMAHTYFNVANVFVLAWFIPLLAKFCTKIIPSKQEAKSTILEPHLLLSPALAIGAATTALGDMTRRAWTLVAACVNNYQGRATVSEEQVDDVEKEIDKMHNDLREYLIAITQRKLSDHESQYVADLFHCINDAERVSDLAVRIYKKSKKRDNSEAPSEIIHQVTSKCRQLAHNVSATIKTGKTDVTSMEVARREIRMVVSEMSNSREDLSSIPIVSALYDVARHLVNIAKRVNHLDNNEQYMI